MSPAAANRIQTPGPGTHEITQKDMAMTRMNNTRQVFSKTDRFKHTGPVLPGIDTGVPGPGAYGAEDKLCIGQYKVGAGRRARTTPRWTLRAKIPLEFAKTSC